MQQRRVRLGDVLDDYCPRERRLTNHAVVAMIEDEVKQTRCTTCDAEHEYKHAKVPSPRRKKPAAAAAAPAVAVPTAAVPAVEPTESPILVVAEEPIEDTVEPPPVLEVETIEAAPEPAAADVEETVAASADDEWPVHRPLIRATLPRPEGQAPERKPTDFTIRQNGGRFDGQRNGKRSSGRHARQAQGHSPSESTIWQLTPGITRFASGRPPARCRPEASRQPSGAVRSARRTSRPGWSAPDKGTAAAQSADASCAPLVF